MKRKAVLSLGIATVALGLGAIQAQGQSVTFNFADNTADGWVESGFGNSPAASVVNIGGINYVSIIMQGGYQSGSVNSSIVSGAPAASFTAAMAAAFANPASYQLTYDWYVDTSSPITPGTYLQLGSYANAGSGFYGQTGTPSAYEPQLNGTQLASGGIFFGSVTVPFTAYGTDPNGPETYARLGFILNGDGTGVTVDYTNIKISQVVPEPATLAMCGMGLLGGLLALRRR
ncbi:MAG TPA: PEP-CTERM sorting domain-containing protein, partial [Verrucomicrobiae bacterium]|nr:PEP-CTERM sorting domain-containing protein [Verrucomicrobiae bacterium]